MSGNPKKLVYLPLMLAIATLSVAAPARAQGLPEGEGLSVMVVACTQCHSLDRLAKVRLTAAEWENALYDMMARGAIVEADDLAAVRNYLANNLATDRQEDE